VATLTAPQIAAVIAAGPSPPSGTTAAEWVALAQRESSGRTDVRSPSGRHVGLWQIGKFHYPLVIDSGATNEEVFARWLETPNNNWRAATIVYGRQGWGAWEASHAETEEARQAVANPNSEGVEGTFGLGDVADAIPDPLEQIKMLAEVFGKALEWITDPNTWRRIALVGAGVGIALVAVNALIKGTDYYQDLESQVTGVVKTVATKGASAAGGPPKQEEESG
jgi:hypothetical protein